MMKSLVLGLVALAPVFCAATDSYQLETGAGYEQLSNSFADGSFYYAGLRHATTDYGWGARWQRSKRFDLKDQEWLTDGYYKISDNLTWLGQAGYSPQNRVRPELSIGNQLAWQWTKGWVVTPGVSVANDDQQDSRSYSLMNEHYRGSWRYAYTLYHSRPEDTGSANTHLIQASYYFNDTDSLTALLVKGKELERLPNRVLVMDVTRIGLFGQFSFATDWSLLYNLSWSEQDVLYEKTEVGLGVRYTL
jgi:YaiO family outer membrane protein